MAVRAQIYQGLLWQQIIDEQKLKTGALLPPLLLVVLYNGQTRWNAPADIRELVALSSAAALWSWQPEVRYHVLDMGAFPGDELVRRRSLAALLFRLERPVATEEVEALLGEVRDWFRQHPDQERLRRLFAEVVRRALQGLTTKVPISNDLLETKMRCNFETIAETWKQQAMAQGQREGKRQGKIEARAEMLVWLLLERFGALTPSVRTKIRHAEPVTLKRWLRRAITAPNLRSVFSQPSRR